jgi:hypothetical protein
LQLDLPQDRFHSARVRRILQVYDLGQALPSHEKNSTAIGAVLWIVQKGLDQIRGATRTAITPTLRQDKAENR